MKNNNFGVNKDIIRKSAVKEFIEKLKEKSFYIQTEEDNYHVVKLSTIEEEYERL